MRSHKVWSRLVLVGFISSCITINSAAQQVVDKVIAVVGDNVVLYSDIEQQIDQMSLSNIPVNENTRCELVEDLMYQKLFVNQAKADSVAVTDEQIEQELNRRLRYFIAQVGSEEELVRFYGKTIDQIKEDFKDEVEELLLIQQMQQSITGSVDVSPVEVREFFASIPQDSLPYINSQARIAQIVKLPPISKAQEDEIKTKLRDFKKRVQSGEDFGTLAYLYSNDPGSAEKNGELGMMDRSELVPEFSNAAIGLKPGEMSNVVKTQFGYHIIQMIERKGERINVRHILLVPQVSPLDLEASKQFLDSLAKQIKAVDTLTFSKAAIKYSTDKDTRMNGGAMINPIDGTNLFDLEDLGQVDRSLSYSIQKMKVGEIGAPELFQTTDGKNAFRIVMLKELTKPHVANLQDDYNRLAESTKRKKENLKLEAWIDKHKNSAFIWVEDAYAACPFQTKWDIAVR